MRRPDTPRDRLDPLRAVADAVPVMLWATDSAGACTYVNRACCEFTGQSTEDFLGAGWLARLHPDDRERTRLETTRAAETGQLLEVEYRLLDRDGEYRSILGRGTPLRDERGQFTGLVGMALDITERERAEAERLALEESTQRSHRLETLGQMAGGIAHDFNNILTAILGHAELAQSHLPAGHAARENVAQIERAAVRAAELTAQMLAYSGRRPLQLDDVELSALLLAGRDLLRAAVSRRVDIRFDLEEHLAVVRADATALRQVVVNLVTNAGESIAGEGPVAVRTGETSVGERGSSCISGDVLGPGDYVFVEVADEGPGIDPQSLPRIFDPFFTSKQTGRGLGLAVVQGIVRTHGGGVEVRSQPGGGAVFRILLPAAKGAGGACSEAVRESAQRHLMVLVIDDEEVVLGAARGMIETLGYRALTAADAESGLSMLAEHGEEIDVVLLDLTMPGPPTEDVLARLSALAPRLPVVLSSGYDARSVSPLLLDSAGFLQKPYRLAQLREVLGRAVAR